MKQIVFSVLILLVTQVSFANDYLEGLSERDCPGLKIVRNMAICTKVPGVDEVLKTRLTRGDSLDRIPRKVQFKGAVDLGLIPDADTDTIYVYPNVLRSAGSLVGYLIVEGVANNEMGVRFQVTTRYNAQGRLVSVTVREL
ncbi:MAG TPA: hypothetical protein VFV50_07160 [Bdellovibrionales bacterium]|nr:hypothetical protein [Bdellovibrionales bacterium]